MRMTTEGLIVFLVTAALVIVIVYLTHRLVPSDKERERKDALKNIERQRRHDSE